MKARLFLTGRHLGTIIGAMVSVSGVMWACFSDPPSTPPCTPQWTGWYIKKDPTFRLTVPTNILERCISIERDGAYGGPITVSVGWTKSDGEKERQDPTGCANPSIERAPLIVQQPTITWIAFRNNYQLVSTGMGPTAVVMFDPRSQPDYLNIKFIAVAKIYAPAICGTNACELHDECGVTVIVYRNILRVDMPPPPQEIDFPLIDYVNFTNSGFIPGTCLPYREECTGVLTTHIRDKFVYHTSRESLCGGGLDLMLTPGGMKYTLSVSIGLSGFGLSLGLTRDDGSIGEWFGIAGEPYKMQYAWFYKREIGQVYGADFAGVYSRWMMDSSGHESTVTEFPTNAVVSAQSSFLGYAMVNTNKDCCPNQVCCQ